MANGLLLQILLLGARCQEVHAFLSSFKKEGPQINADDTDKDKTHEGVLLRSMSSASIRGSCSLYTNSKFQILNSNFRRSRPTRFLPTRVGPSNITSNQTCKSHPIINLANRNTPKPVRSEPLLTTATLDLFDPPRQPKRPRAPGLGCSPPRRVD